MVLLKNSLINFILLLVAYGIKDCFDGAAEKTVSLLSQDLSGQVVLFFFSFYIHYILGSCGP